MEEKWPPKHQSCIMIWYLRICRGGYLKALQLVNTYDIVSITVRYICLSRLFMPVGYIYRAGKFELANILMHKNLNTIQNVDYIMVKEQGLLFAMVHT